MGIRVGIERPSGDEPPSPRARLLFHAGRVGIVLALALLTYALFPTGAAVESPIFEVGSVATRSVIAPFAFAVRKSDAELAKERDELARSAKPIFVYVPAALDTALRQLDSAMDSITAAADVAGSKSAPAAITQAAHAFGVELAPEEATYLSFAARRRALHDALRRVYVRFLGTGIASSAAIEDARGEVILQRGGEERSLLVDSLQTFGTMLSRARALEPDRNSSVADGLYLKMLSAFFHPTIALDRVATDRRRLELRNTVDTNKYAVRTGEKIVGEHEVVGRPEFDKMRALHQAMLARTRGQHALGRVLGGIAYNALLLMIVGFAIALLRPALYRQPRAVLLIAALFLIVLAVASVASQFQPVRPELVPVALAAIILSVLFDARISMIAAMLLAVLVGGQGVFRGTNALFLNLVGGATAALSARVLRPREQWYRYALDIALGYVIAALAIGLTLGWRAGEIGTSAALGALNALVSVVFAMFLVPLAERFTGITTQLTLLEYSDLNRPLLKRLSLEAPGTYAHTIAMANLVEAACNAVGANGLLGRVGTYYHDIGKLKKPQYFVENQASGRNPHDKLKPGMSASIIRNHIREGLELAHEHRLPKAISAFIPEHHGTAAISYFLEKAKERDGDGINPSEYAYPGPLPQTAETAIAMLADGVEPSVRVLTEPTSARIREVIDHIVRQRVEQGQLRDAPLTLRQLEIIKEQFARVLTGMYHNRIDYPVASGGVTSEFAQA